MRHLALAAAAVLSAAAPAIAQDLVAKTEALAPDQERAKFRLPEGFEAQLVASEPDIHKPMNLAFDDQGRLWVTDTLEYPYPAPDDRKPRDTVKVLSDFGPDGKARKIATFADGLNIPIGLLPLTKDSAWVHGIPNIKRFTDADGDGKADRREQVYGTYGSRDTHGMTSHFIIGFDGWVYACHGFANDSEIRGADGLVMRLNSGNVYRMRVDGSHAEQITWGQVNPFGLSFDGLGNLYSCDCHSQPVYMLLRQGYYPSFGKPHDGLGYAPEMTTDDHGSTGIAGVAYYEADQFPEPWRGTMFIGNPVTAKINHDHLEWHGSSPKVVRKPDFLVSDDPWFRPVDLEIGPDGALYVADFYNRIIGHYEVPLEHPGRDRERGRIWRIVYKGAKGTPAPADFAKAEVAELAKALGHPNLTVRLRATHQLSGRGGVEVAAAARGILEDEKASAESRAQALWVLRRVKAMTPADLSRAARDKDRLVRTHAQKVLADLDAWGDADEALALAGLKDADPFVRRNAADALGVHPDAGDWGRTAALISARQASALDDTHYVHVLKIALRNQLRGDRSWAPLAELGSENAGLAAAVSESALGLPSAGAAGYLLGELKRPGRLRDRLPEVLTHIARYGDDASYDALVAWLKAEPTDDPGRRSSWLKAVAQGLQARGKAVDPALLSYATDVARELLKAEPDPPVRAGTEMAESLKLGALKDELQALGLAEKRPAHQRAWALVALAAIDPGAAIEPLGKVISDRATFLGLRNHMASVLGNIGQPKAREYLVGCLGDAPSGLQTIIASGLCGTKEGAETLLEALSQGKASPAVLNDRAVEIRLRASGVKNVEERIAKLREGLPPADESIRKLIEERRATLDKVALDEPKGKALFTQHCSACHQVGGQGGKVGPQLDGVGVRGPDRLLEDILDPNRNVDQAFRATVLALEDGRVLNGLVLREEGETIVFADSDGKENRIAKGEVEERKPSPLSPMPAKFGEQIPPEDLARLIRFLLEQKAAANPPVAEAKPGE